MTILVTSLMAVLLLMLLLKLTQRLTLRLRILAGVSLSRSPQKSCPHLGLAGDPFSHEDKPADTHRCYLWMQRDRIDLVHQKGFCLSTAHYRCPWLMVRKPANAAPSPTRVPAGSMPRRLGGAILAGPRRVPALAASIAHVFHRAPAPAAEFTQVGLPAARASSARMSAADLGRSAAAAAGLEGWAAPAEVAHTFVPVGDVGLTSAAGVGFERNAPAAAGLLHGVAPKTRVEPAIEARRGRRLGRLGEQRVALARSIGGAFGAIAAAPRHVGQDFGRLAGSCGSVIGRLVSWLAPQVGAAVGRAADRGAHMTGRGGVATLAFVRRATPVVGAALVWCAMNLRRLIRRVAPIVWAGALWLGVNLGQLIRRVAPIVGAALLWLAVKLGRLSVVVAKLSWRASCAISGLLWRAGRRAWSNRPAPVPAAAAMSDVAPELGAAVFEPVVAPEPELAPLAWPSPAAGEGVWSAASVSLQAMSEALAEGLAALDRGSEALAYELFATVTKQKPPKDAAPAELLDILKRAWFWRAKTADTVEDVVHSLERALELEPASLQLQAQLAWARQRLDREDKLRAAAPVPAAKAKVGRSASAPVVATLSPALSRRGRGNEAGPSLRGRGSDRRRKAGLKAASGEVIRVLGGMAALALAALWMTTGVVPAIGRLLATLPVTDQILIGRLVLTVNGAALPGQGHLALPMINYDLGLSLPFVLAFLFVFTARGLVDGDTWARTGGFLLAAAGGWLCWAVVANPEAAHIGLMLCAGIVLAAMVGRFDAPKVMRGTEPAYS